MSMIKSYAAKEAGGELEVYEYDPGELKPQDVEVQVDYCGICHSDLSMIDLSLIHISEPTRPY